MRAKLLLLVIALIATSFSVAIPQQPASAVPEQDLKLAYLHKFCNYVIWPGNATGEQIIVGILGSNVTDDQIEGLAKQKAGKIPIRVKRIKGAEEAATCQLVYVCNIQDPEKSEPDANKNRELIESVSKAVEDVPVLIVTEFEGALELGASMNFVRSGEKLKFEISQIAVKRAKLEVSARLMSLASYVKK